MCVLRWPCRWCLAQQLPRTGHSTHPSGDASISKLHIIRRFTCEGVKCNHFLLAFYYSGNGRMNLTRCWNRDGENNLPKVDTTRYMDIMHFFFVVVVVKSFRPDKWLDVVVCDEYRIHITILHYYDDDERKLSVISFYSWMELGFGWIELSVGRMICILLRLFF